MKLSSMLIYGALWQTSRSCDCTNSLWLVFDSTRPFRNPGNFWFWNPDCIKFLLWNPESRALKSGKQFLESGIPLTIGSGFQVPLLKNPEYGTFNLESTQPRCQSSSAISDVTSPVKLVGKIRRGRYRTRFQASSGNSDSENWPGYEAGIHGVSESIIQDWIPLLGANSTE